VQGRKGYRKRGLCSEQHTGSCALIKGFWQKAAWEVGLPPSQSDASGAAAGSRAISSPLASPPSRARAELQEDAAGALFLRWRR